MDPFCSLRSRNFNSGLALTGAEPDGFDIGGEDSVARFEVESVDVCSDGLGRGFCLFGLASSANVSAGRLFGVDLEEAEVSRRFTVARKPSIMPRSRSCSFLDAIAADFTSSKDFVAYKYSRSMMILTI